MCHTVLSINQITVRYVKGLFLGIYPLMKPNERKILDLEMEPGGNGRAS